MVSRCCCDESLLQLELNKMRSQFLVVFVSASLPLFLTSCGVLFDKSSKQTIQRPSSPDEAGVSFLNFEDEACQSQSESSAVEQVSIWEWNGSEAVATSVKFKGIGEKQEGALASDGVKGALTNITYEYECQKTREDCKLKSKPDSKNVAVIKICKTNASYQRDSLESMTLTSQYFLSEAYKFYQSIASHKGTLEDTILLMQPKFRRSYSSTGAIKVDADNAAFSGDSKLNLFVVYPFSKAYYERSRVHLWEVPFTMKHEYGHHVC